MRACLERRACSNRITYQPITNATNVSLAREGVIGEHLYTAEQLVPHPPQLNLAPRCSPIFRTEDPIVIKAKRGPLKPNAGWSVSALSIKSIASTAPRL